MKKFFKDIWSDIIEGKNIELYLIIALAIIVLLADVFGVNTDSAILEIVLATLAILVYSMIDSRRANENVRLEIKKLDENFQKFQNLSNVTFIQTFPETLKTHMETAEELWLVGITFSRTIKTYYPIFEKKLRQGHIINILLVDPESPSVEVVANRIYKPTGVKQKQEEILNSLQDLCNLAKIESGQLNIRTISDPLKYGGRLMNPDSPSGTVYIEQYAHKQQDHYPRFVLESKDGYWYDFYVKEIKALWNDGKDWNRK